jgi:hypothetical protein
MERKKKLCLMPVPSEHSGHRNRHLTHDGTSIKLYPQRRCDEGV